jgi:rubrerythrin
MEKPTAEWCEDCQRLRGARRSTRPHKNLESLQSQNVSSPMGAADENHYRCRVCGKTWLHETGSMGFGWVT